MGRRSLRSVEECYRGRDVRVFRLDQAAVMARLRERAQAVLQRRADVIAIKLFGSLARDQGRPGSDADLFVVVRDGAGTFLDRIAGLAGNFQVSASDVTSSSSRNPRRGRRERGVMPSPAWCATRA